MNDLFDKTTLAILNGAVFPTLLRENKDGTRTWSIASSQRWYRTNGYLDLIQTPSVYAKLMLEPENKLLTGLNNILKTTSAPTSVVDIGPGDGKKISLLYDDINTHTYIPIDVAAKQLAISTKKMKQKFTHIHPIHAEFKEGFAQVTDVRPEGQRLLWYLGSTFSNREAFEYDLVNTIHEHMGEGDWLYLSTQQMNPNTCELITAQYALPWCIAVSNELAAEQEIRTTPFAPRYDPIRESIDVVATITAVPKEYSHAMFPGDEIMPFVSAKPRNLREYVTRNYPLLTNAIELSVSYAQRMADGVDAGFEAVVLKK